MAGAPWSVRFVWSCLTTLVLVLLAFPGTTGAMVTEPPIPPATQGIAVPQPTPAIELTLITSRGFMMADGTLAGLFASRGDTIDSVKDAQTAPGTFSPQCGFTVQLVLAVGSCRVGIGWYNVIPGSAAPPPQDQIYMFVPAGFPKCAATIDPATACCDDTDFCPLATYDTTQTSQHRWNMTAFSADSIRNDARYTGGLVGFVVMGAGSSTQCDQNKYSQLELNAPAPNGQPWVGAVVYPSTAEPGSYYVAFEESPTTATSWKGQNNANDGDFNDSVLYIKGATCVAGSMGGATGTGIGTGGGGGAAGMGGAGVAGSGGGGVGGGSAGGAGVDSDGAVGSGGVAVGTGGTSAGSGGVTVGSGGISAVGSGGLSGAGGGAAGSGASGAKSGCSYVAEPVSGALAATALGLALALAARSRRQRR